MLAGRQEQDPQPPFMGFAGLVMAIIALLVAGVFVMNWLDDRRASEQGKAPQKTEIDFRKMSKEEALRMMMESKKKKKEEEY